MLFSVRIGALFPAGKTPAREVARGIILTGEQVDQAVARLWQAKSPGQKLGLRKMDYKVATSPLLVKRFSTKFLTKFQGIGQKGMKT